MHGFTLVASADDLEVEKMQEKKCVRTQVDPPIVCNACGRTLPQKAGITQEDYVFIEKKWGYFSRKDGDIHTLRICETCFDRMLEHLAVPAQCRENTVLMDP